MHSDDLNQEQGVSGTVRSRKRTTGVSPKVNEEKQYRKHTVLSACQP